MLLKLPHHLCLLTPFSVPTFINFSPEDHVRGKTSAHPRCFYIPTRTHPLAVPYVLGGICRSILAVLSITGKKDVRKRHKQTWKWFSSIFAGNCSILVLEWLSTGSRWLCSLVSEDSSLCAVKYSQRAKERLSKHSVQERWGVFHLDLV